MTTILEELRKLDEAHKRGEVEEVEYRKLRREVMDMIEDAEVASDVDVPEDTDADETPPDLLRIGLFILAGIGACVLIGTWLFGDPMLAFTIGVAALAAVTIQAARQIED